MATINPKSGGINNNIGSILHAGTPAKASFNSLTLATNSTTHNSPKPQLEGVGNSGLGTVVPYSGADYSFVYEPTADQWIGKVIGTAIGGVSNNLLRSGAAGQPGVANELPSYEQLDITSWDASTGAATVGGDAGVDVLSSGIDGTTGKLADDASRGRGEFSHSGPGLIPTQASF